MNNFISDFLTYFDKQETIDEECRIYRYTIVSQDATELIIFISVLEHYICFTLITKNNVVITGSIYNIAAIICDKNQADHVKFLFYEEGYQSPILTAYVKPSITLKLNLH